jgi:hypothetical protein
VTVSVSYRAVLPIRSQTVVFVTAVLYAERVRRNTRAGTRSLTSRQQAIMILRWLLDGTRLAELVIDNRISTSTGYDYLHEGLDLLAARKPSLPAALLAAKIAGYSHVNIDGTLIYTDRCGEPGPTPGVDAWWSGKHHHHGGNIQVVSTPDGWPLWTSDVRHGREHDTTCLRTHAEMLPALKEWTGDDLPALADLGYEGEATTMTVPIKRTAGVDLDDTQRQYNLLHAYARARAEQANAVLKTTFKALRHVSLAPQRIGVIVAAALVILHIEHNRTT